MVLQYHDMLYGKSALNDGIHTGMQGLCQYERRPPKEVYGFSVKGKRRLKKNLSEKVICPEVICQDRRLSRQECHKSLEVDYTSLPYRIWIMTRF